MGIKAAQGSGHEGDEHSSTWHRIIEGRALIFTVFSTIAVLIGGVAEIVPALIVRPAEIAAANDVKPYLPLEVEGRDVYILEGCYNCHSQMIRPMRFETLRYGDPSKLEDSVFDHPFQWGSKRTGPDLAREGGRYPNMWHYQHLVDPRAITAGSNMPPYAHLALEKIALSETADKLRALRAVGVPYTAREIELAEADARAQGAAIAADLAKDGTTIAPDTRMIALIAYLQRLGRHAPTPPSPSAAPVVMTDKETSHAP